MLAERYREKYPVLKDRISIRNFEVPILYNTETDELYELDEEAYVLLKEIDGRRNFDFYLKKYGELEGFGGFFNYLIEEGLLYFSDKPVKRELREYDSLEPSLRHMLIHITFQCNLNCKHCYLEKNESFMSMETFRMLIDEFDRIGGLKIMISGGEPFLHPELKHMIDLMKDYDFRKVLITNGTMLSEENCNVDVDEVQISIDGIVGHDRLRGKTFEKVVEALELLKASGIDVSVATMINKFNLDEFEEMRTIFMNLGLKSWMVDYPSPEGNLKENEELLVDFELAGALMRNYGFIDSGHRSHGDFACGAHMCASDPGGNISRCGFFKAVGNIRDGIEVCWEKLKSYLWKIEDLKDCKGCEHLETCKGGCRFRAKCFTNSIFGKDPVMCSLFG